MYTRSAGKMKNFSQATIEKLCVGGIELVVVTVCFVLLYKANSPWYVWFSVCALLAYTLQFGRLFAKELSISPHIHFG
jgi:hypothetical protein